MVDLLVGRKVMYETAVKTAQESGQSSKVKTDRFFFCNTYFVEYATQSLGMTMH